MQYALLDLDYFAPYNSLMSKVRYDLECKIKGCGNPVLVASKMLCNRHYLLWRRNGSPLVQKRRTSENNGGRSNKLYKTWSMIHQRCTNPKNPNYKNYGGRGVKMYEPWKNSFTEFNNYILENLGERPEGMTLDRINTDGNYEPGNLRWADHAVQMHNRRVIARSGVQGVIQRKDTGKWVATIKRHGVLERKEFDTLEDATEQRKIWEEKYYG